MAGLTAAAITGILSLVTTLPAAGTTALGTLAGLLLAALYLLDPPQPPHAGQLKITTAALMTLLLLTGGPALTILVTEVSLWATALAISILGGPPGRLRQRSAPFGRTHAPPRGLARDLATTAGALQITTVLFAAHHAGFPPLTLIAAGIVLWPATVLLTAVLTPRRTRQAPLASTRSAVTPT
ncbi:hypothetical protein [Streptomyces sp. NRRL S-1022]|uniref:hypothetical protein n=1 Tax=Streptomyces sp. NRRL S-1022 TaxID=1463880 RepID=UPI0004BF1AC0|nr:hypothetical protein [Streptomyces sp. NRRL S-1022]